MEAASPSFLAASQEDQMLSRLSTRSSKTRKTFCLSCRRKQIAASLTLWSSPIRLLPTLILEFWSTDILVALFQITNSWKSTSSLGSFRHQPHEITISKASNPTVTRSSLKTVTKIPTACLRSCQTTICNPREVLVQACITKTMAWRWTGVPRPFRSQILTAWCQTSSSSWQSSILEAVVVTPLATAGTSMAITPLPLESVKGLRLAPPRLTVNAIV